MIQARSAVPATPPAWALAEGPLWDPVREQLWWVDVLGQSLRAGRLEADGRIEVTDQHHFPCMISAAALAPSGDVLLAAHDRLVTLTVEGDLLDGPVLLPDASNRRLNDGAVDPAGRFLVGSLSMTAPSCTEVLLQVHIDGTVRVLDDDLYLSNGLAWSADGSRLYSVDTLAHRIWVRDYDAENGRTGPRRVHLDLPGEMPDGIAMDVEDHLWVAVWGAGEVRRYAPDGRIADRVSTGAPHTSCVAFAGPDMDVLAITTARAELSPAELAASPGSGSLFTAPAPAPGVPVPAWAGPLPSIPYLSPDA